MDENEKERLRLSLELFPNIAAHLRGALGNIEIAVSRMAPPEARDQDSKLDANAAILYQSYYRLLRMVNNFSDAASFLEHDALPLQNEDIVALTTDLCGRVEPLAESMGLTLRFQTTLMERYLALNAQSIERLLFNLISNSFKFTPAGGEITVELKASGDWVLLSVSDTGVGIPEDMLPTLFDRYLHTSRQDPPPHGLGLGLPLCRHIARAHGGTLMAISQVNEGTKMTLSLPYRKLESDHISDVPFDYTGGFNRTLLELSDALPTSAFLLRNLD